MAAHLAGLDSDNAKAWNLTHQMCTRFLSDSQAIGPVLVRLTSDLDEDEFADLLRRISLIYDVLVPPPQRNS